MSHKLETEKLNVIYTNNGNILIKFSDRNYGYFDTNSQLIALSDNSDYHNLYVTKFNDLSVDKNEQICVEDINTNFIRLNNRLIDFYHDIGCRNFYGKLFNLDIDNGQITFNRYSMACDKVIEYNTTLYAIKSQLELIKLNGGLDDVELLNSIEFDINKIGVYGAKEMYVILKFLLNQKNNIFFKADEKSESLYVTEIKTLYNYLYLIDVEAFFRKNKQFKIKFDRDFEKRLSVTLRGVSRTYEFEYNNETRLLDPITFGDKFIRIARVMMYKLM